MSSITSTKVHAPPTEEAKATSAFVNGHFPKRRKLIIALSALAGFGLTVVWSASFVDSTIGDNVAAPSGTANAVPASP